MFNIASLTAHIASIQKSIDKFVDGIAGSKDSTDDVIPGDVVISNIFLIPGGGTGAPIDLTGQIKGIEIFESLFVPCVCAELMVGDSLSVIETYNIQPGDYVTFTVRTPGPSEEVAWTFAVRELASRTFSPSLKMQTYTIPLVSVEALHNSIVFLEYKAKDNVSKIVRQIFNRYIKTEKNVKIDPTVSIEDLPPLTSRRPFQAIHYLLNYAYSSKYKSNAYVFFENRDGYHFAAVEKLLEQGVKSHQDGSTKNDKEFFYDAANKENIKDVALRNILAFNDLSSNSFDDKNRIINRVASYDFLKGQYSSHTFNPADQQFETLRGPSNKLQSPMFSATYGTNTSQTEIVHLSTDTTKAEVAKRRAARKAFAYMMELNTLQIYVYGDTNITVGDVIKCNLPRASSFENTEGKSEMDSGLYLVTKVRHMILNTDRPQHTMALELKRCLKE